MDTKPLPAHPSLEQFKKQAKDLLKNVKSGHPETLQSILRRIGNDHAGLGRLAKMDSKGANLRLTDVQFVIARDYGFESWPKFVEHIESLAASQSHATKFETAVDAVVNGDTIELERLLREFPELVRERSARLHHATLLHYVGANGVENYRQKPSRNAVKIAAILLEAGSEVNAIADIYGGSDALGLAATSVFPALAGVQEALIDILLEHGANLRSERIVNACLANGRGRAAEHLAERGAPLDLEGAAGVGRLDLVKGFFDDDRRLKNSATQNQMERGFIWACEYGHTEVVDFLLKNGVDVNVMPHGETGLHWAAFGGHVDIVERLLEKKAALDVKDKRHSGTPLGWALHAWNSPHLEARPDHYHEVVALLARAGAIVDPGWFNSQSRNPIVEKIRSDPRMLSALKGKPFSD